ncbi:hypothetical protein Ancab_002802 [Ancistrocladus abbreviatus]
MAQSRELLLIQFLMPDNGAPKQAEDQIKRLTNDPLVSVIAKYAVPAGEWPDLLPFPFSMQSKCTGRP